MSTFALLKRPVLPAHTVASEVSEIAQDFQVRGLRVIGVHQLAFPPQTRRPATPRLDLARVARFRNGLASLTLSLIYALDAPSSQASPSSPLSATAKAYAVVDRAGCVAYRGKSLGAAMGAVANLLDAK